ncbi:hypothetical protein NQZ68_002654 [Dissostichus eleginoides]|nr:hypothetical protein NQZ68_002654 [Dissostichus eleginoides]
MGISVSHSSSPNWHLTAAPHGLLAGCVSARSSQRRKLQRRIKHHPAERALSPAPFTLPPPLPHSLPLQLSRAGSSLHPRQPQALIIAFSQSACRSEIHPSSPTSTSTSIFPPLPPALTRRWKSSVRHEDVRILKMFSIRAPSQKARGSSIVRLSSAPPPKMPCVNRVAGALGQPSPSTFGNTDTHGASINPCLFYAPSPMMRAGTGTLTATFPATLTDESPLTWTNMKEVDAEV